MDVFLMWDDSRAEHGEGPQLLTVYGSLEAAEAHIRREQEAADYGDIDEDQSAEEIAEQVEKATEHLSIETRAVIG